MKLKLSNFLKEKNKIEMRETPDGAIALNLNNESYYTLDESAYLIYQELISQQTIAEAITKLLDQLDVDQATLEADVLELAEELINQQFLEVVLD